MTRYGVTQDVRVGTSTFAVTFNRWPGGCEMFAKATDIGHDDFEAAQGHLDTACTLLSLGLQGRCSIETAARHLRGNKTPPLGIAGTAGSLYDGLGRVLEQVQDSPTA